MIKQKTQKWIIKTFCKTYYDLILELLCKKEAQIENLKKINEYLRNENQKLKLYERYYNDKTIRY